MPGEASPHEFSVRPTTGNPSVPNGVPPGSHLTLASFRIRKNGGSGWLFTDAEGFLEIRVAPCRSLKQAVCIETTVCAETIDEDG